MQAPARPRPVRGQEPTSYKAARLPCPRAAPPFEAFQSGEPKDGHVRFAYRNDMSGQDMRVRAQALARVMQCRRSIRFFDPARPIPDGLLEQCIATAAMAPSGAHQQPWRFVIVRSRDAKARIREAVEREERVNYERRMRRTWVEDVAPLVSKLHEDGVPTKPYLEDAPALVVVTVQDSYTDEATGERHTIYYPKEGVGIACGILITALTNVGLFTLTSTPMGAEAAIRAVTGRPDRERVFLLMPVGFPAADATVPYRAPGGERLPLPEIMITV